MNKDLIAKSFFFVVLFLAMFIVTVPSASAKVVGYVTSEAEVYYEYPYDELLRSYVKNCVGSASPLFDDYISKKMVMFLDDDNGYVDYHSGNVC